MSGYARSGEESSGIRYPYLDMSMRVKRYPWNWFFNCVLPLFIIQGSLISSYAITSGFQDRAGVSITLLLAIVAFKYVVSEKLPTISYLTLIDMYVLGSFLINAMVILDQTLAALGIRDTGQENTMTWALGKQDNGEAEEDPLEISKHLSLGLVLWLGAHLLIITILVVRAIRLMREEEYVADARVVFPSPTRALPHPISLVCALTEPSLTPAGALARCFPTSADSGPIRTGSSG